MKKLLFRLSLLSIISTSSFAIDNLTYDKIVTKSLSKGNIEYFIQGKGGIGEKNNTMCENGLFFNDYYLAVFDGATDKSGKKYDGKKGGRVSRDIIQEVFQSLPAGTDKEKIITLINEKFKNFYAKYPDIDFKNTPHLRPTATLIWYDLTKNELIAIGDSKARIDNVKYNNEVKYVDELNSTLRVKILKDLKLTNEQIEENDIGRFYIMPLLTRQSEFQNNPNAPKAFQYWAIDGFDIPISELKVWKFDKTPKVIELSSDGYETYPKDITIDAYENTLKQELSEDPLRIKNPSTKGITKGNYTFDDRAILIYRSK
ncbi:hypothetical protein [Pasteurella bettyae]|uniref:hypothetical protein n=1 Tax=Pasteurella bettyae TaxID=752 RepID=UPI003D2D32EB